jgi:hypothetical protein
MDTTYDSPDCRLRCGKKVRQLPLIKRVYNHRNNPSPLKSPPNASSVNDGSSIDIVQSTETTPTTANSRTSTLSTNASITSNSVELVDKLDRLNLTFTLGECDNDLTLI